MVCQDGLTRLLGKTNSRVSRMRLTQMLELQWPSSQALTLLREPRFIAWRLRNLFLGEWRQGPRRTSNMALHLDPPKSRPCVYSHVWWGVRQISVPIKVTLPQTIQDIKLKSANYFTVNRMENETRETCTNPVCVQFVIPSWEKTIQFFTNWTLFLYESRLGCLSFNYSPNPTTTLPTTSPWMVAELRGKPC